MSSNRDWLPKIDENEKPGVKEFLNAVKEGNITKIKEILGEKSFAPRTVDQSVRIALVKVRESGGEYRRILELLANSEFSGVRLSHVSEEDGTTLLMAACALADSHFYEILISNVRDEKFVFAKCQKGNNCMHYLLINEEAPLDEKMTVFMKLLRQGVDYSCKNSEGFSPLALAIRQGNFRIAYELSNMDQDKEQIVDSTGDTMLHLAVRGGNKDIFDLVNIPKLWKVKNKDSLNPYELARQLDCKKFLKVLEIHCQESVIKKSLDALAEINKGDFESAEKILDKGNDKLTTNKKYEWNHFLTQVMLKPRNNDGIKEFDSFFRNVEREQLEDSILLYNKAVFEWNMGNSSKSIESIVDYLQQNESPEEIDMYFGALVLLFEASLLNKNIKGMHSAVSKLEEYTKKRLNNKVSNITSQVKEYLNSSQVICKLNIGENSTALIELLKAIQSLEENNPDEAKKNLEIYNKIAVKFPKNDSDLRHLYKFVKFYCNTVSGQYSKCVRIYKKNAEQAHPNSIHYNNGMGIMNIKLKKYAAAETFFKLALRGCKTFVNRSRAVFHVQSSLKIKFNLALAIFFQGRYEEALKLFRSLEPYFIDNPIIHYRIGLCEMEISLRTQERNDKHSNRTTTRFVKSLPQSKPMERVILPSIRVGSDLRYSNNVQLRASIAAFREAIVAARRSTITDQNKNLLEAEEGTQKWGSVLQNVYCALVFCLNRSHCWSESLFYIKEFESTNSAKAVSLENYKIECLTALGRGDLAKEIIENQLENRLGFESRGTKFFSDCELKAHSGLSYKLALYINLAKVQLLKNNLQQGKAAAVQILKILNKTNAAQIEVPSWLVSLFVYYYLLVDNSKAALRVVKTHLIEKDLKD